MRVGEFVFIRALARQLQEHGVVSGLAEAAASGLSARWREAERGECI